MPANRRSEPGNSPAFARANPKPDADASAAPHPNPSPRGGGAPNTEHPPRANRPAGAFHTSVRADRMAKALRRTPTFSEAVIWKHLRRLEGWHFRRQAPIGSYIVDFVSYRARLVVEIDGGVHQLDQVRLRDARRDAWLSDRGFQVLRIDAETAGRDPELATAQILHALEARTTPPPRFSKGSHEIEAPLPNPINNDGRPEH